MINPTYYCNTCRTCRQDRRAFCPSKLGRELGIDCDGSMADFVVLPDRFLHPVPEHVSDQRAVMVEPLACVLNNLRAAAPGPAARTLVLGGGPIGALCALVLAHRGAPVTVVEPDPHRAGTLSSILPSTVTVSPTCLPHERADVVIDTVGTLPLPDLDLVADGATIVIMGSGLLPPRPCPCGRWPPGRSASWEPAPTLRAISRRLWIWPHTCPWTR